jgi:hypothetical protein
MSLLRTETRTDYLGDYVAYIYSDGHVESDPVDRPVYKEDYLRKRTIELSKKNSREALAAARLARTSANNNLNREQTAFVATAGILDEFRRTQSVLGLLVDAAVADRLTKEALTDEVDTGGDLIGDRSAVSFEDPIDDNANYSDVNLMKRLR